ncbi:MAG: oxygen-independent coproporphyrinogen III oxidase [Hyphomicrobiales bacterium]
MSVRFDLDLIERLSAPVPRYTSYPTAPHFYAFENKTYANWLRALPENAEISLYLHIPFCDTLCWFCGCTTKHTLKYSPISNYLKGLEKELRAVSAMVPKTSRIRNIHWGGGSPTILNAKDIRSLAKLTADLFTLRQNAEFSVEIDPRGIREDQIDALLCSGLTRASIGVQDFDPNVQQAINRIQPFEETQRVVSALRDGGVTSINLDVLYGLPHQTEFTLAQTIEKVGILDADRVSLFGYAHVPWMKSHQRMIKLEHLPDIQQRFQQAQFAAKLLTDQGYTAIGMDHFAKPDDTLARAQSERTLKRNFQGYTAETYDALLGVGASAISQLPQGYVQNHVPTSDYLRAVNGAGLAACKGFTLTYDDAVRAYTIERLMCDFELSYAMLRDTFGASSQEVIREAMAFAAYDQDRLCAATPYGLIVTAKGKPFIRTICAWFDTYLKNGKAKHSLAV